MLPLPLLLAPAILQGLAMLVDEGWCHRKRGLGRWERVGHPIDTLSVAACYALLVFAQPEAPHALAAYVGLTLFSCVLITKDEPVHSRVCGAMEGWLHAVLFLLHPIVFIAFGLVWHSGEHAWLIRSQLALTLTFAAYQSLYWSVFWKREPIRAAL